MTDVEHAGDMTQHHSRRRSSLLPRDGEGMTTGPNIRRMSRWDARPSVQYGYSGRRMSHVSRSSISGASYGMKDFKAPVQLQNTYRTGPGTSERFQAHKVEEVMKSVLDSYLGGEDYSPDNCSKFAQTISDVIVGRVKDLGFSPRYKFVCLVTIGQDRHQGLQVCHRSLWNTDTDSFASAKYHHRDLFAVASLFATYFE